MLGPSTAPCSPAPGRRLLIIRNDSLIEHNHLSTFEGLMQLTSSGRRDGKERRLTPNPLADLPGPHYGRKNSATAPSENGGFFAWRTDESPKKKWGILRNFKTLSVSSNPRGTKDLGEDSAEAPQRGSGETSPGENGHSSGTATPDSARLELQHSFRFSLEWMERPHKPSKERRLYPPRLPVQAQLVLESRRPKSDGEDEQPPVPSKTETKVTSSPSASKYIGRALSEWTLIVLECQNFFERRMMEGVQSAANVETPVLAMDAFRKHAH